MLIFFRIQLADSLTQVDTKNIILKRFCLACNAAPLRSELVNTIFFLRLNCFFLSTFPSQGYHVKIHSNMHYELFTFQKCILIFSHFLVENFKRNFFDIK